MGVINIVQTVKQIHKSDVVLVKIGKFYHVYGKDSYIMSYLFGYKLKEVEKVSMCGFPESSINKVTAKLEKEKINYLILDRRNNYEIYDSSNNKNLNTYGKYFEKAKEHVNKKIRIDNICSFLINNMEKENFKEIIMQMEDIIKDERRKVSSN